MAICTRRREFIVTLGNAAAGWPRAGAQVPSRPLTAPLIRRRGLLALFGAAAVGRHRPAEGADRRRSRGRGTRLGAILARIS
jgi:hypothetical protein